MGDELDTVASTAVTAPPVATMVEAETLTPEEAQAVQALAKEAQEEFLDDGYIGTYGAKAQTEVAQFARAALGSARVKDTGEESRRLISEFQDHLVEFKKNDKPHGLSGLFARGIGKIKYWLRKYQKIEAFIDEADQKFKKQITELTVDLKVNDKAHEVNLRNRRALIVHIWAGRQVLEWARQVKLAELQSAAERTQARGDIETASDFSKRCDDFELKLGRLNSSLAITYIRKPEIDLLRDSQKRIISLLEDLLNQAIPLWLEEMRITINLKKVEQSNEMAAAARDMTEGLFESNIERLGQAGEAAVRNVDDGLIRTAVIIQGTDKLLASLAAVDTACQQAITNSRRYEQELADNTTRINEEQAKAWLP